AGMPWGRAGKGVGDAGLPGGRPGTSITLSTAGQFLGMSLALLPTAQIMFASGNDRRSAATAGSVCTTSPIELSLTIIIRISLNLRNSWIKTALYHFAVNGRTPATTQRGGCPL